MVDNQVQLAISLVLSAADAKPGDRSVPAKLFLEGKDATGSRGATEYRDGAKSIRNIFPQLQFLDRWMEAFRQRKWDLVESSLRSLIGSFENCSKASKKSPVPAYFVTNKISPSLVREIVLTRIQPNA